MDELLKEIYYKPGFFSNTQELFKKAKEKDSTITLNEVKEWLDKQQIHQISKQTIKSNKPKFGHFNVTEPNHLHQLDILYLPRDKKGFKYALTIIDTASRYKAAQPLKKKTALLTAEAIEKIYDTTPLKYPRQLNIDKGSEFKREVLELYKKHNTRINVSETGFHKATAMVERFNRTLAERLFKQIHHKEIETGRVVKDWVDILQPTIDQLNSEISSYIKMAPNDAIKLQHVPQKQHNDQEATKKNILNIGDEVRHKLAKDRIQNISHSSFVDNNAVDVSVSNGKRRATDPIYSLTKHKIVSIKEVPNHPTIYYIDNFKHGFTSGNLQKV